jgi:redox-sensitive bicupin YhaK (pirin superfamily)
VKRSIQRIVTASPKYEGEGFLVHRPFPIPELHEFDPFMLLDEMGPMDVQPGEAKGAPDHPHRGFETVTYLLSGRFEHRDSHGHSGRLAPGDVQWMTAGSGLIHSEMPESGFLKAGGRLHGLQLWVNLPMKDKMIPPHYHEIPARNIPVAASADGSVTVRVIAGESLGRRAVIDTRTPIQFLHFRIAPGSKISQPVPREFNTFAYILDGKMAARGGRNGETHQMLVFARDGDEVDLESVGEGHLDVILIAGQPLGEPVARWGPFVMNTRAEIMQAVEDYQSGRMGSIAH